MHKWFVVYIYLWLSMKCVISTSMPHKLEMNQRLKSLWSSHPKGCWIWLHIWPIMIKCKVTWWAADKPHLGIIGPFDSPLPTPSTECRAGRQYMTLPGIEHTNSYYHGILSSIVYVCLTFLIHTFSLNLLNLQAIN